MTKDLDMSDGQYQWLLTVRPFSSTILCPVDEASVRASSARRETGSV